MGSLPESVVALDVLLARGLVLPPHLHEGVAALPTGRGSRRARTAVALADGRAESPPESRLRVLLRLAGLTPEPQFVVRGDGGQFIARVDLAFPAHRVAVEYDGVWHGAPQQVGKDRRRQNRLTAAGWTVTFVTAADLRDPVALLARIAATLSAPRYA